MGRPVATALPNFSFVATFHSIITCDLIDMDPFKPEIKDWCTRSDYLSFKKASCLKNYEL